MTTEKDQKPNELPKDTEAGSSHDRSPNQNSSSEVGSDQPDLKKSWHIPNKSFSVLKILLLAIIAGCSAPPVTLSDSNTMADSFAAPEATVTFADTGQTGVITEDAIPNAVSDSLSVTDPDGPNTLMPASPLTATINGYGTFTLTAEGMWTYTLNNDNDQVNSLPEGMTLTDNFSATSTDGSASVIISITITGANDASVATASAPNRAIENTVVTLMGSGSDVDTGETISGYRWNQQGTPAVSLSSATAQNPTFTTPAVSADTPLTFTLVVTGNGQESLPTTVSLTVTGNLPATFTGDLSEDITEDSTATLRGQITVTDNDDPNEVRAQTNQMTTYGIFNLQTSGGWAYALRADADNAIAEGMTAQDTIAITASDGTEATLTIAITRVNDLPVFGSTGLTASLTEDSAPNTVSASLSVSDVNGSDTLIPATTPATTTNGFSPAAWVIIIGLILITSISMGASSWMYYLQSVYVKKEPALVPERWESIISELTNASNAASQKTVQTLVEVLKASKYQTEKSESLLESFLTLQSALTSRDEEIERLKKGYDSKIFKRFLMRFIRVSKSLNEIREENRDTNQFKNYSYLGRLMDDALEECGVEQYIPEIGSDYRDSGAQIGDDPTIIETKDPEQDFKISSVESLGYVIEGEARTEVIIPAKVSILRFTNNDEDS